MAGLNRRFRAFILKLGLILFHGFMISPVHGQTIKASLEFQADSFAIGQLVPLRMVIEHPAEIILVFPEARDFTPFELVSREPEPTQTINGISWDIVIYKVRSFSLAKKQAIRLPYSYYSNRDTIRKFVSSDSILMKLRTPDNIEGLSYKAHTTLIALVDPPDYLSIGLWIAGILLILIITGFILRKPLERYLALRKIDREWRAVKRQLKRMESLVDQTVLFDQLNHLWKKYLDPDDVIGLRSMTTTELRREIIKFSDYSINQQQVLINTSRTADQVIYAGKILKLEEILIILEDMKKVLGATYLRRKRHMKKKK